MPAYAASQLSLRTLVIAAASAGNPGRMSMGTCTG